MEEDREGNDEGAQPRRGHGNRRRAGRSAAPRSNVTTDGPPRRARRSEAPSVEPDSVKPARELLEGILSRMGVPTPEVRYIVRTEGEYLEVRGPDLANLIGRHGHTLEALNLIFNNIVNAGVRNNRRYYTIDAEGYRARRADQLKAVALATLERAVRERKPQTLEPMLPSERKVIHLALADNPYVTTESTGVDPERRVVISPK
jgi:spoIIIJ-associated protein